MTWPLGTVENSETLESSGLVFASRVYLRTGSDSGQLTQPPQATVPLSLKWREQQQRGSKDYMRQCAHVKQL